MISPINSENHERCRGQNVAPEQNAVVDALVQGIEFEPPVERNVSPVLPIDDEWAESESPADLETSNFAGLEELLAAGNVAEKDRYESSDDLSTSYERWFSCEPCNGYTGYR